MKPRRQIDVDESNRNREMVDRKYMAIAVGVVIVVIVLGFFGYKNYDCGQHQARYNYYVNQLNQINHGVISSIASALVGQTQLIDEGYYINTNCKILGMSAAEGNTT
jgi:hypothetical protein